jgi:hypothetical protein
MNHSLHAMILSRVFVLVCSPVAMFFGVRGLQPSNNEYAGHTFREE